MALVPNFETDMRDAQNTPPIKPIRRRILEAAADLIVNSGYTGCTMRAIAEVVKIHAGSLYHHFSSKEEIVTEIISTSISDVLEAVTSRLAEMPADASFSDRIDAALRVHLLKILEADIAVVNVYEHLPPHLRLKYRDLGKKYIDVWLRLFQQGVDGGDVIGGLYLPAVTDYFLGGLNRIPQWFHSTDITMDDVVHLAKKLLFDGISKSEETKDLHRQVAMLKEILAEQAIELRSLKQT